MESQEFFIYITLPAVWWPCERISLQPNWVTEIGAWCVGLTTLPIWHVDSPEIWDSQTAGTLWVCNRTVLLMLYLTSSSAALFLRTSGSQIWSYCPRLCHANFLRSQNNFWVGHWNLTAWMEYFKFKTELNVPFSPTTPAVQKISFIYCRSHISSTWICFHLGGLFAVWSRQTPSFSDERTSSYNLNGQSKSCKCLSGLSKTLSVTPIINRKSSLL
jgi:hypothetical protein